MKHINQSAQTAASNGKEQTMSSTPEQYLREFVLLLADPTHKVRIPSNIPDFKLPVVEVDYTPIVDSYNRLSNLLQTVDVLAPIRVYLEKTFNAVPESVMDLYPDLPEIPVVVVPTVKEEEAPKTFVKGALVQAADDDQPLSWDECVATIKGYAESQSHMNRIKNPSRAFDIIDQVTSGEIDKFRSGKSFTYTLNGMRNCITILDAIDKKLQSRWSQQSEVHHGKDDHKKVNENLDTGYRSYHEIKTGTVDWEKQDRDFNDHRTAEEIRKARKSGRKES